MSSPTRWAGVPLTDRRTERRALLVDAGFQLFGDEGEAAVSVRSICRECGMNTRYFYESFADVDELLGAVYDRVSAQLAEVVGAAIEKAGDSVRARTRAGIAAVLGFSSADPRHGRVLFTEARANPVLAARRAAAQELLREGVLTEGSTAPPARNRSATPSTAASDCGSPIRLRSRVETCPRTAACGRPNAGLPTITINPGITLRTCPRRLAAGLRCRA